MNNLYGINKVQKIKESFFDKESYESIIKKNNGKNHMG